MSRRFIKSEVLMLTSYVKVALYAVEKSPGYIYTSNDLLGENREILETMLRLLQPKHKLSCAWCFISYLVCKRQVRFIIRPIYSLMHVHSGHSVISDIRWSTRYGQPLGNFSIVQPITVGFSLGPLPSLARSNLFLC